MYNFFVSNNQIENEMIGITGSDANHISNVLRMKKEDEIYVCNLETKERYLAKIYEIKKEEVIAKIVEKLESTEPTTEITLYQGIPKSDKMEYIIQKAVELGVYEITPIEMRYCIGKIKEPDKKIERWQKISEAAAKQSKRNKIPRINLPQNVKEIYDKFNEYDLVIIAYEDEGKQTIKQTINENRSAKKIAIIIGPEGGISKEEVEELKKNGAKAVSLGKQILRTETASIEMISIIMYEYEM